MGWGQFRRLAFAVAVMTTMMVSVSACGEGSAAKDKPIRPTFTAADVRGGQIDGYNRFAMRLTERLLEEENGNMFVSPFSIATALALAANGAEGDTRRELLDVLGVTGKGLEELNHGAEAAVDLLQHGDPAVRLSVANGLWSRDELSIKQAYVDTIERYYGAESDRLDFDKAQSADKINRWVRKKTDGRIDGIVSPDTLRANVAILVNAVSFKAAWSQPFAESSTREAAFQTEGGSKVSVPMMRQRGLYSYKQGDGYSALRLPYGSGKWGMTILLPDQGRSVTETASAAAGKSGWGEEGFVEGVAEVELPRFKLRDELQLKKILQALGVTYAFQQQTADFTGITGRPQGMYISGVLHKTFVEVNERGTEAAAATSVEMSGSAEPPPKPFRFVVDRPFLFVIAERTTGAVVFTGVVTNPAD